MVQNFQKLSLKVGMTSLVRIRTLVKYPPVGSDILLLPDRVLDPGRDYWLSKKSWLMLYSNLLYKKSQDTMDIQVSEFR